MKKTKIYLIFFSQEKKGFIKTGKCRNKTLFKVYLLERHKKSLITQR
jgi:hypothetical protein